MLKHRQARQADALHAQVGTLEFFKHHHWLLHGRTRPAALRALHVAHVWVPILRREIAETRASLASLARARAKPVVDDCLAELISRESGWRVTATNARSGAYGLPQALPGSKMASAGADWRTNPFTQIRWMLGYVTAYGGSCGALAFQKANGWY